MKVLFAVSNENISESIVKKYQKEYKEIISSKNVYYFNAIQKELQKDLSQNGGITMFVLAKWTIMQKKVQHFGWIKNMRKGELNG